MLQLSANSGESEMVYHEPIFEFVKAVSFPAFLGLLGGAIHVLVLKYGWKEKFNAVREILLGAFAGILYSLTGLPDSLALIAVGFSATDIVEAFLRKRLPIQ